MVYNARVYEYVDGLQLRVYNRPVICNQKVPRNHGDTSRKKSSDVRTLKQEKHCSDSSMNRTIQNIFEISRANTWDWFLTFTFNPEKIDSTDYDLLSIKVSKWMNNTRTRFAPDMKYLLVPELHKDGKKYHFHALIYDLGSMDIVDSGLVCFQKHIYPYDLKPYGTKIYNLPRWDFGWTTATRVKNNARVASYITKYITKELLAVTKNKKRYWHSRNCDRPKVKLVNLDYDSLDSIVESNIKDVGNISTSQVPDAGLEIMYIEFNNKEGETNDSRRILEKIENS